MDWTLKRCKVSTLQEFRSSSKRELEENISQLYETVNKLGSKEVNMFMTMIVTMMMVIMLKMMAMSWKRISLLSLV